MKMKLLSLVSNQRENKYFTFFISKPRLLRNAVSMKNIHTDGTHKITTEKLPLIVIGSTDIRQTFHLIGIAITKFENADAYTLAFNCVRAGIKKLTDVDIEPSVLICDADPTIPLGYERAFDNPPEIVIMCYAHVMANVQRKYTFKNSKQNKEAMKSDIRVLHLSINERMFDMGCQLFLAQWKPLEPEVCNKLETSFFKRNKFWFIGAAARVPKSNNGLERCNGTVKLFQTDYKKRPLQQFLPKAFKIVRQRSKEYRTEKAAFETELEVSAELMKRGKNLKRAFVYSKVKPNGDRDFYMFASGVDRDITMADVERWMRAKYRNFKEFKAEAFKVHRITFKLDVNDWKMASCSCAAFNSDFMCKHVISIAYNLGVFEDDPDDDEDPDYDDEPLFTQSRGRPPRDRPALQID